MHLHHLLKYPRTLHSINIPDTPGFAYVITKEAFDWLLNLA